MQTAVRSPELQAKYEARKRDCLRSLGEFGRQNCRDEARVAALVTSLHKLAGVAGLFGDPRLGTIAAESEAALRNCAPERREALIGSIREIMFHEGRVAWPVS
ncbi:Hpt domain-containing protein [Novosphingobium album (ex Liu et al. 2023)]|nr:Hpt domain-containing protein [Novosphingobium album (ex Liu et al. 2023)]